MGSGERGYAESRVAKVLPSKAFSALVLRKIILYARPKRERKARDGAGLQSCCCRLPVEELARAEAVQLIRRCQGCVPLQSLPLMAVPGLRRSLIQKRPIVHGGRTTVRVGLGACGKVLYMAELWQRMCTTAPLWQICVQVLLSGLCSWTLHLAFESNLTTSDNRLYVAHDLALLHEIRM